LKSWISKNITLLPWLIFGIPNIMSIYFWSKNGSDITNVYRFFPLLGLLAFSTMWGHYVVWAIREYSGAEATRYKDYSRLTHWFVLVCILLHPGLIVYKLHSQGFGLPPVSYESYVGKPLVGFVTIGTLSLFAFLLFELKKYLQIHKRLWKSVLILNHMAMFGIILHAFKIGTDVKSTDLWYLWVFYGVTLLGIYVYLATRKKLI
jgi:hypothetical protein